MIDVLLVLPPPGRPYPKSFSPFAPPLGLAYLASALRQAGYSVAIRDYYAFPFKAVEFDQLLEKEQPKVVGLSTYTENFPSAILIASRVKRLNPRIKVVLGGPHASHSIAEQLPSDNVDAVVRGDAEIRLVHLVRRWLEFFSDSIPIPGVTCRDKSGGILVGEKDYDPVNPNAIPLPARDLLDLTIYQEKGTMLTARGCGRSCIFCVSWHGSGQLLRAHLIEQVITELRQILAGHEVRHIHFWDETFTADRERTIQLCQKFLEEPIKFSWSAGTRVDLVDPALMAVMAEAGCVALNFGVESGVAAIVKSIGKVISLRQVEQTVLMAAAHGIYTTYNFMLPAPDDTPVSVRQTLNYALKLLDLGAGGISFNIVTPFPGTALYEESEKFGIQFHDAPWEDYHYWNPVISTRHMSRETIRELFYEVTLALAKRRSRNLWMHC